MSEELLKGLEVEAVAIKRRELTKDEKIALGDEMLKGTLKPDMDRRKRKNAIRTAIESVGRSKSTR